MFKTMNRDMRKAVDVALILLDYGVAEKTENEIEYAVWSTVRIAPVSDLYTLRAVVYRHAGWCAAPPLAGRRYQRLVSGMNRASALRGLRGQK